MTATGSPTPPRLEHVFTFDVVVDPTITIGRTVDGVRRVIPIRGGRVHGPAGTGVVLDAGADFQKYPADDVTYLEADYVLRLDDGHHIMVENRAIRVGSPKELRAMVSGGTVEPDRIYFRCVPRLTADEDGPHAWMNRTLFIGTGERSPGGVRIEVFRVR